jgi:hypothetical protein
MAEHREAPAKVVARLRSVCLALPEAYEEQAWVGTRWRIRKQTFAHVLMVVAGWPPAYAQALGAAGPACVLTFRSQVAVANVHSYATAPFFRPRWWPDIVGMVIDAKTDWDEVAHLVSESYRVMAPNKLADAVGDGSAGKR